MCWGPTLWALPGSATLVFAQGRDLQCLRIAGDPKKPSFGGAFVVHERLDRRWLATPTVEAALSQMGSFSKWTPTLLFNGD